MVQPMGKPMIKSSFGALKSPTRNGDDCETPGTRGGDLQPPIQQGSTPGGRSYGRGAAAQLCQWFATGVIPIVCQCVVFFCPKNDRCCNKWL